MILTLVPQLSAMMFRGTSHSMAREMYECRRARSWFGEGESYSDVILGLAKG